MFSHCRRPRRSGRCGDLSCTADSLPEHQCLLSPSFSHPEGLMPEAAEISEWVCVARSVSMQVGLKNVFNTHCGPVPFFSYLVPPQPPRQKLPFSFYT